MPDVVIRGPWSRRTVLLWTATLLGAVGVLKVAVRQAADPSEAPPGTVSPPTPTLPRPTPTPARPYTPRARWVIEAAQREAFERAQPAYDQEDLLLGIATVPDSAGLEVLRRLGVSQERLRAEAEAVVAAGPGQSAVNVHQSSTQLRPAPRAQTTLSLAADEARDLKHGYIGVEHLLLGILRQGDGPGYGALDRLGVALAPARAALGQHLAAYVATAHDRNGDVINWAVRATPPAEPTAPPEPQ
ncbi:MAG TPA: Clp protease N-terminal domain-containing protein [Chloroflexota bacterium]|nr:Clp protease N-terminal domain-containing protein [Chloroflexota bacterium]